MHINTTDINPINTKKIYQYIIEKFIDMIKEGKLKTGERLPSERTLAEMFNVSRTSIREALRAMEIIGILEVRQGEGSYITDLNIAPFINTIAPLFVKNESLETDLLDFRKLLEVEAVKLAATRTNGIELLEKHLKSMREALEKDDISLGAEADIQFHKSIFALTGNVVLIKAAEFTAYILESSVRFNRAKILENSENSKVLYEQHKKIYEAIKQGNPVLAAEIMEKHLDFVKKMNR
ncbi:MAG TPA: FadR family transcriptional regulator [Clostridiaceae bacterium]|nr:FadR family transcriptional regulator [Clostridiaceae bacterium]